eukprot:6460899-Amphidinium_carterae.1
MATGLAGPGWIEKGSTSALSGANPTGIDVGGGMADVAARMPGSSACCRNHAFHLLQTRRASATEVPGVARALPPAWASSLLGHSGRATARGSLGTSGGFKDGNHG